MTDTDRLDAPPKWGTTRRLVPLGRVVISQTPTDPGDIGEPRIAEVDETTYEPHDASIVYITRRSFTLNAPGNMTYHRPRVYRRQRSPNATYRTNCGLEIWSNGWEPGEQSSLIAIRRDVASRIARQCGVCEDSRHD